MSVLRIKDANGEWQDVTQIDSSGSEGGGSSSGGSAEWTLLLDTTTSETSSSVTQTLFTADQIANCTEWICYFTASHTSNSSSSGMIYSNGNMVYETGIAKGDARSGYLKGTKYSDNIIVYEGMIQGTSPHYRTFMDTVWGGSWSLAGNYMYFSNLKVLVR